MSRLGGEGGNALSCDVLSFRVSGEKWRDLVEFLLEETKRRAGGTLRIECRSLVWDYLHCHGRLASSVRFSCQVRHLKVSGYLPFIPR